MEIEAQKAFVKRQHMRQTFCFCSQSSIEEFDTGYASKYGVNSAVAGHAFHKYGIYGCFTKIQHDG